MATFFPTIYRINETNDFVDSLHYSVYPELSCSFSKMLVDENNDILLIGTTEKPNENYHDLILLKIDQDLNILDEHFHPLTGGSLEYTYGFLNSNGNYCFASLINGNPPSTDPQYINKIIFEVNPQGELIFDSIYDHFNFEFIYDFIPIQNTTNYLLYCFKNFDGNIYNNDNLNILDQDYNIIDGFRTEEMGIVQTVRQLMTSEYLISGRNFGELFWQPVVKKYSSDFILLDSLQIFEADTNSYPSMYNCMELGVLHNFSAYTFNIDISTNFSTMNSYINVNSFDDDLNLNWIKFYGGDAYYMVCDIKHDNNNGLIVSGTKYTNGISGPYKRDIFILHIDENGLITSTNEEESIPIKNAIITPNPGKEYLQLHTGVYPAKLQLFNINGHLIFEDSIHQNTTTLNTQNLKPGTYIWQLIKNGEVIENGKWVKE